MGTVKISENKLILKKDETIQVYVKTFNLSCNSWIVYNGYIYELENNNIESDVD
jgi:hypothetical protein